MEQKNWLVKTGDFLFKYRNALFPLMLLTLFFTNKTADRYDGKEWIEQAKDILSVGVVLLGLGIRAAVIGFKYIKRGGLNKKVYAENLVTDGFFGVCRNPLYVGNIIIYFGVLMMHGSPVVLGVGMACFFFIYTAIVAAEEYFLRNKFGAAYEAYCRDVPRWGLQFSQWHAATQGMKFNLKRALVKDYGTIMTAVVSVCFLETLEEFQFDAVPDWQPYAMIVGVVILVALAVRIAKKKKLLVVT